MNKLDTGVPISGGRMRIPRSRGAASGFLLIVLGVWGALIPFVGPYLDFAYSPDQEWTWTVTRGWLEVLPGAATVVGGLLLLSSRNRATAMFGGWLTVLAGAWFVVGRAFAAPLGLGDPGAPVASTDAKRAWLEVCYFSGLGALIVFLGALALGRLSVRSLRDIQYAQGPIAATAPAPAPVPAATETAEPTTVPPRHAEPATEPVAAPPTEEPRSERPRHRKIGHLFRRHPETTTTGAR